MNDILEGYQAAASRLIKRYDALSSAYIYQPVIDLMPHSPVRAADIGAGTGRDAAWLASLGHDAVGIEPVAALREAGQALHQRIQWIDDQLPKLARVDGRFGLILLCAVWQHLDDQERSIAISSLARIAEPGGLLILSLRNGSGAEGRRCIPVNLAVTLCEADAAGFNLVRRVETLSVQQANRDRGVTWTWLALRRR